MTEIRIAPLEAPYQPAVAEMFARVTPPGKQPLKLFRTMARNPRVLQRMFAGNLLDDGTISLRDRELIILRTCARCGSEYEWGVHVAFFAERAGIDATMVAATCTRQPQPALDARDSLLLRLADELHDGALVGNATWDGLAHHFNEQQLLELIALAGYYHTISFITNAIGIEREAGTPRFTDV